MMDIASQAEQRNKKRGLYTSIAVHIGLLLLALLPLLTFPDYGVSPEGQDGKSSVSILVPIHAVSPGKM